LPSPLAPGGSAANHTQGAARVYRYISKKEAPSIEHREDCIDACHTRTNREEVSC